MDDPDKTQEWVIDDVAELLRRINECEKRYQSLIETNLYGVQVINIHGKITYVNAVQCEILDYTIGELEGKDIWKLLASEFYRKSLTDYLTKLAKEEQASHPWSGEFLKKDGKIVHLSMNWSCMRNEQRNITGFISFTTSIGGNRASREEMLEKTYERETKEKFYQIAEAAKEMILAFNTEGEILYINERGAELVGYFKEELMDMNIADILPPDQLRRLRKDVLNKQTGSKEVVIHEVQFINRNLNLIPVEVSASMSAEEDNGADFIMIGRSLARNKKLEKEILRNLKFESSAAFAGGIVRDLNDLLTSIIGNIDFARMDSEPEGKIYKRLSDARSVCLELRELTRKLTDFSRGRFLNKESESLATFIQMLAERNFTNQNIICEFPPSNDVWQTEFDKEQIQMMMTHLIINAHESSPPDSLIRINVENIMRVPGEDSDGLLKEERYVRISVQDQGIGISKSDIEKIFDPYFTTKETGTQKGRGLGLTIVYAIVKRHNGYIDVDSKPGRTVFHIWIPVVQKEIQTSLKKNKPVSAKGRILVMDDEAVVRNVMGQMLLKLGYEVAFSENGNQTIDMYQQAKEKNAPFDAVILDLHIKEGMNGTLALRKLLTIDPNVKTIVSSGYSNDPEMMDYEKYGFSGVLEKPYTVQELRDVLSKILI